ncbi:tripartite tricarboxylate transporter substrate binding protein [Burkholderia multivorans]|uniref:Tripartite tricarboxylate transporter substrate binding protein n=1 Tax=Burkholderia multivorans TaxID=87883 RepID=A0AAP2HH66_9BURK|nr:tripartite tricarboxylate transporter substrate-binding protein [Burkholderia multivorans]MBU9356155.1 tripartite tricarboxylate transporter substrate binding protein [Burkholderia multivorans]MBU9366610.1 tripartite tricarboxylate transporter substrate binding protein [Burkholderia multivorans]MBU9597124.1 tripartite tricarboxylate transporter substrate binding protein [Burkholderia multivorans]MCA8487931.1 tripartite tricarboxylate transporter substrate binding protein [Burkholderia multiv
MRRKPIAWVIMPLLATIMCLFTIVVCPSRAYAHSSYPSRSIRLLVGFNAAGATDAIARYYASKLGDVLRTSVYVDNRPGAYQMIAIRALKASAADGYTLFLITGSAASQYPALQKNLPYDPHRDFSFVGLVGEAPGVIVASRSLPVSDIDDLVKYCKAHPGLLNFGSSGIGSASHIQMEYLSTLVGIRVTHVPFKADAEITTALLSGSVQLGMMPIQGALPAIQGGMVRALAVTGKKRVDALPNVPTLAEARIPGLENLDPYTYYVLVGPRGLPPEIVQKLNDAINAVSRMPETIAYMHKLGFEPGLGTPRSVQNYISQDTRKWADFHTESHFELHIGH